MLPTVGREMCAIMETFGPNYYFGWILTNLSINPMADSRIPTFVLTGYLPSSRNPETGCSGYDFRVPVSTFFRIPDFGNRREYKKVLLILSKKVAPLSDSPEFRNSETGTRKAAKFMVTNV